MEIQAADRDRLSSGPRATDPINAQTFDESRVWEIGISDEDGLSILRPVGSNPAIVLISGALLLALAMASTWVIASVLDWPGPRRTSEPRQLDGLETASSAPQHGSATPVIGGRQPNTAVLIEPKRSAPRAKQSIEAPRKTPQNTKVASAPMPESRTAPPLTPVPETKPTTILGWIIREADGTSAVLEGPTGIQKVSRGDTVPQVGRIDSILRWGDRWIVATSSGLISTP